MKRKEYEKPQMRVNKLRQTQQLLTASKPDYDPFEW